MLLCLRHGTIVCGNNQQAKVYFSNSGDHIVDELSMSGYVNKSELIAASAAIGISKIDCQSSFFLFNKAVRVYTGESSY